MIKELWEQIQNNQDVRQNLSKLRQELKQPEQQHAFLYMIAGKTETLFALLYNEDAKTRKNAALLLGTLGKQEFLQPLYEAYEAEQQLFVKSAYLTAISHLQFDSLIEALKQRLHLLTAMVMTEENRKHYTEEIRQLTAMLVKAEGTVKHEFCKEEGTYDIILLTNRDHTDLTRNELMELAPDSKAKTFGAGVMAQVSHLRWRDQIRTYQELLFLVKGMKTCPLDPVKAASLMAGSDLLSFLTTVHAGDTPFYFRVDLKSKMELDKKSAFAKKLAAQLEQLTDRRLINSTSAYEFEIRLIENKEGCCNVLIKLNTLEDERFAYRIESAASSIKPVNAALTAALAKKYMVESAQVLDPFCGVGTMLIERHKAVRANTTYGIDYSHDAIEKARLNTEAAGQIIHYVQRNFFDFTHDYLFDEIITNMPFTIGRTTEDDIQRLYRQFFPAARKLLKDRGIVILYTHNKELVREQSAKNRFRILEEMVISKKEGTWVIVLRAE